MSELGLGDKLIMTSGEMKGEVFTVSFEFRSGIHVLATCQSNIPIDILVIKDVNISDGNYYAQTPNTIMKKANTND